MAKQDINNGTTAGDKTGEFLFTAFNKINQNSTELYSLAEGSVNAHSDVNLQSVTNEDGYVVKILNGVLINAFRKVIFSPSLQINTTSSFVNKINTLIDFPRAGTYSIDLIYSYSYDATNSSFISRASLNNNPLSVIFNNEAIRLEPKESGGNDGDGRGTDQKLTARNRFYFNVLSAGPQTLLFSFAGSSNGIESAVWDASVVIEEEYGILTV
jgi:hypothetical protein